MPDTHNATAALHQMQDAIYREKVLRARSMTGEERLAAVCDLTNGAFERMHEGAMWQLNTTDPELGWAEVRRRMERLDRAHAINP